MTIFDCFISHLNSISTARRVEIFFFHFKLHIIQHVNIPFPSFDWLSIIVTRWKIASSTKWAIDLNSPPFLSNQLETDIMTVTLASLSCWNYKFISHSLWIHFQEELEFGVEVKKCETKNPFNMCYIRLRIGMKFKTTAFQFIFKKAEYFWGHRRAHDKQDESV